ncbi:hypothetical protein [Chryseobacterium sp.]|uniref:hypothetical protein n=1 Tax=Chryseobacterium sp. TaxID=1871047 RepID=UPI00165692AE|nr:hypothetical protein [Chryseobacterium sp.]
MATQKNNPPTGVLVAVGTIALMIILYFIILAIFPELFESLPKAEVQPVKE